MQPRRLFRSMLIVTVLSLVLTPAASVAAPTAREGTPYYAIQINEIMFYPSAGEPEWVELKNTGSAAIEISGYSINDEDENRYLIPDALPPVPGGAFVIVVFDGSGPAGDDYDFTDHRATLHTPVGLVNVFEDGADQCALYARSAPAARSFLPLALSQYSAWNPPVPQPPVAFPVSPLLAFVAWGAAPGDDAAEAGRAGLWNRDEQVNLYRGLGFETEESLASPGEPIGLIPGRASATASDWAIFQASEATPGEENAYPVISWQTLPDGATVDSATFAIGWMPISGATGYRFQLDRNPGFAAPLVDQVLAEAVYTAPAPVPEGAYFWRVKALFPGGESPWSLISILNSLNGPGAGLAPVAEKTLGVTWLYQHKDTNMLCLEGDPLTGDYAWNTAHVMRGIHGNQYCGMASIAMLASYYGGKLSQDRISYEIFSGKNIENQLGHNKGPRKYWVPFSGEKTIQQAIDWALGTDASQAYRPQILPFTFQELKDYIDAGRPVISGIPGHLRVIDGYREFLRQGENVQEYHLLDPWDAEKWVVYGDETLLYVFPGPAGKNGAPNVRSDEDFDLDNKADTMDDSDGDGVVDFDEVKRFKTYTSLADSDADQVPDGIEIRSYVFNSVGEYSLRSADIDGDEKRAELDPDNDHKDNDGLNDGCEDNDRDGVCEFGNGETDNFDPTDDMLLHVQLTWPLLGSDVDLHLIRPGGSMGSDDDVYYGNGNPDWGLPGTACDDPRLDVDCITGCTVENIRLSKLEPGTYRVVVYYYSDHGLGDTTPAVMVDIKDNVYHFGPHTLANHEIWYVATIEWPSMKVTAGSSALAPLPGDALDELGK